MDKKILALAILLFIVFAGFVLVNVTNDSLQLFTRASANTRPSAANSLIFAWPLEVPADGKTKSVITIFVRNTEGKGLVDQTVTLSNSLGQLDNTTARTDDEGKATFNLTSTQSGVAQMEAMVDNIKLQRTISVKFK